MRVESNKCSIDSRKMAYKLKSKMRIYLAFNQGLGHKISYGQVEMSQHLVKAIADAELPKTMR